MIVASSLAEASLVPSGLKHTECTLWVCPTSVSCFLRVATSHSAIACGAPCSHGGLEATASVLPSGLNEQVRPPDSEAAALPAATSHSCTPPCNSAVANVLPSGLRHAAATRPAFSNRASSFPVATCQTRI